MKGHNRFFAYARERYRILQRRREGKDRPWTKDPILQNYRFCNVFREDDTTTQWIRSRLTDEAYGPMLLQAMVIARWFNRMDTLGLMLGHANSRYPHFKENLLYQWDGAKARKRLKGVQPLVTGAYMVKTPAGMNKLDGLIWCIDQFIEQLCNGNPRLVGEAALCGHGSSLQATTEWLTRSPYLGPFMAYEVVTDLRHTKMLCNAPDIMTWANPGPGANRGAGRVLMADPLHFKRWSKGDRVGIDKVMRKLLKMSTSERNWRQDWPRWEMREVEHTLCEFDKYERARLGEGTPKQRYQGAS